MLDEITAALLIVTDEVWVAVPDQLCAFGIEFARVVVIAVAVDDPQDSAYGGVAAAPVSGSTSIPPMT